MQITPDLPSDASTMSATEFFAPKRWLHGTFLHERRDFYQQYRQHATSVSVPSQEAFDQVREWHESMGMTEELLSKILEHQTLTLEAFAHILDGHLHVNPQTDKMPWLRSLKRIMSGEYNKITLPDLQFESPEDQKIYTQIPFHHFFEPFMQYALTLLDESLLDLEITISGRITLDKNNIRQNLLQQLTAQLLTYGSRTLVLELNIARLQGILEGETSQERYQYFNDVILSKQEFVWNLLHEYAVLARFLVMVIETWHVVITEVLEHIATDLDGIKARFGGGKPLGKLELISGSLSDLHKDGRNVHRIYFDSGVHLIYKPKSLKIDEAFQTLLHQLNAMGLEPQLKIMDVWNRGKYGWTEFIEHEDCRKEMQIREFYQRQGAYLALLYILEAVDFHSENLIANGDSPFLIDLEALFHHRPSRNYPDSAYGLASKALESSVLRTGLLPQWIWAAHDQSGVDISGIGGEEGQMTPRPIPLLSDLYKENMRVERRYYPMQAQKHRPRLNGQAVSTSHYVVDVIKGFEKVYDLAKLHQTELIEILRHFEVVTARQILRGTRTYSLLHQESQHPDHLRNGLDRNRLLDRLWLGIEQQTFMWNIVPSEQSDLLFGNIPIFETKPTQTHLWDSRNKRFDGFFSQPSLDYVYDRIRELSTQDREQQLGYLRGSLASIDRTHDYTVGTIYQATDLNEQAISDPQHYLQGATEIGQLLDAAAFLGEYDAAWIGLTLGNDDQWLLEPIGIDMYNGVAGIALFLGYLGALTKNSRTEALARRALQPVLESLRIDDPLINQGAGVYSGKASAFYVVHHLTRLWQEPEMLDLAFDALPILGREIEEDTVMDILGGVAGALVVLLDLYDETQNEELLQLAIRCGERICENAKEQHQGVGWYMTRIADPMAGFAHGVSGIAWALLRLAKITQNDKYHQMALRGIEYERSLFVPAQGNWLDVRNQAAMPHTHVHIPTRWCHGAPGVVLGRLLSLPYIDNDSTRAEIEIGIQTMLISGFGGSHCLCHGDLGNAEILNFAGKILQRPDLQKQAQQFAGYVLNTGLKDNWRCGLPQDVHTPGLMVGLAGIGMGLLRMAAPEYIPSIVCLESAHTLQKL